MGKFFAKKRSGKEGATSNGSSAWSTLWKNIIISTAFPSAVSSFTGHKVISTDRLSKERLNQGTALGDNMESSTGNLDEKYNLPVKWPQKRHHRVLFVGATQACIKLIPTTSRKTKFSRRNKSIAPLLREAGLFGDAHGDVLPV